MSVEVVGVVGAGTMGAGIAAMACLGDYPTRIQDPDPDVLGRAEATVSEALAKGAGRAWSEEDAERASGLLTTVEAIDGLAGCDFVVEAAPERLDLKQGLFADLAEACGPGDDPRLQHLLAAGDRHRGADSRAPSASSGCTSSTRRRG